jgi:large subunit ribosomal protein L20
MSRVKRGSHRRELRKKLLSRTKGFYLKKSKLYKFAKEAADRAGRFSYRDRRARKRDFRRLWIIRIGAAARLHQLTYSQLMYGLKKLNAAVDRKILADLAVKNPKAFGEIVKKARTALAP